jgi:predicted AlkP superfamily phosphohydrolase/phosphomutase/tetratricopeptide (TPR) repeat protein
MVKNKKRKVLLIGWDAADWKVINPLMDSGQMPTLQRLVENGVIGNIATLDPPLSPMLWTSIATGKRADKHGILGFVEPNTDLGGVRNITSTSRTTRAIWNILHHEGYNVNVVGWWPSHPAEPINGVMVSNFFQKANREPSKPWPVPSGAISPKEYLEKLRILRIHPFEITQQHLLPFIPDAAKIDQEKDKRLNGIAKILAENATIQAVTTWLMQNTDWDFMGVYFDGIDHFSHGFMSYHPPQIPGLPDEMFQMYKGVVSGAYIFHDMMLERLIQLAGEDPLVIIVSDHGFYSDHLRPRSLPKFVAAAAYEHSPYGIFCINGPGIKKDERIFGATLLDVTPTLLAAIGLPVGEDMDGKVLVNAFENPGKINYIESWDKIEGDFGEHAEHKKENVQDSAEALQQLIDLGYIENPGEDKIKAMKSVEIESKYNLSRVYFSKNDFRKAKVLLEELIQNNELDIRFNVDLATCYLNLLEFDKVRVIVERMSNLKEDDENKKYVNIALIEGKLLFAEGKPFLALAKLQELEKKNPFNVQLQNELGKVYLSVRNFDLAKNAFLHVLQLDTNNANAYHGLAVSLLRLGQYEVAAERALDAIGLLYHFPNAHFHLGEALYHMKIYSDAANAFETALLMIPVYYNARKWLIEIYSKYLNLPEKAKFHRDILEEQMKGKITIVSGLPRSGTSMMMQMLEAGGIDVYTDFHREADESNPKGYYESEKVKSLARDNSWMEEANGKAIKVIAQLLKHLPNKYEYKIIFMQRKMEEIITSQQKMLGRDTKSFPVPLLNAFNKELQKVEAWANENPNVTILNVNYSDAINNPGMIAQEVNKFLDYRLDIDEMIKTVDPRLYHNKSINQQDVDL